MLVREKEVRGRRGQAGPWIATAALAVMALGCGKPMVQASGVVKYEDGSPVTGAIAAVQFQPTEDSTAEVRKAASAELTEQGEFTVMTKKPADGIYRGRYAVTFTVLKTPGGPSLIDRKYNRKTTTPFTVDVDGDKDDYEFVLERKQ